MRHLVSRDCRPATGCPEWLLPFSICFALRFRPRLPAPHGPKSPTDKAPERLPPINALAAATYLRSPPRPRDFSAHGWRTPARATFGAASHTSTRLSTDSRDTRRREMKEDVTSRLPRCRVRCRNRRSTVGDAASMRSSVAQPRLGCPSRGDGDSLPPLLQSAALVPRPFI